MQATKLNFHLRSEYNKFIKYKEIINIISQFRLGGFFYKLNLSDELLINSIASAIELILCV